MTGHSPQQIARHITHYFLSTIFVQAVGLLRSVVIPVLFSPAQLGVWNLMNVIIGYGGHAHFGLLHGMNKMIPLLKGQSRTAEFEKVRDSMFWANLLIGISGGCVLLIVSFRISAQYAVYVQIVAVVFLVQQIYSYFSSLLRAESNFDLLIKGANMFSLLSTVLVVAGAFLFVNGLLGALIGFAAAFTCAVIYWLYKSRFPFSFVLDPATIRKSLILGVPLLFIGFLDTIFMSVDRWIITKYLNMTSVGYYSLAVMASSLLATIPASSSHVLYPRMLERFAVNPEPGAIKSLLIGPLRATSVVMLLLIAVSTIGLPLLIRLFLPKYLPSIPVIEILVPSSFFLSVTAIPGFYLTSIDKQRYQIIVIIIAALLSLIMDLVLFFNGFGILGVALGTSVGYFVYGFGYVFMSVYLALGKKSEAVRFMGQLIAPFLAIVLIIGVTSGFVERDVLRGEHILSAIWRMVVLMGVLLPTIWAFNRDGEVLAMARTVLRTLVAKGNA